PTGPRPATRSAGSLLDELDQGPEAALGVHEGDRRPPAAGAWLVVDRRRPGGHHRGQRGGAVVDAVADVVQALAALVDRLRDRGVGAGRGRELDVAVGDL